MTANPTLPIKYGSCGATAITGNCNSATLATLKFVTLSSSYVRSPPPGYPVPVCGQAVGVSLTNAPQTIANGTRLQLFGDEADALVTAGFATYS